MYVMAEVATTAAKASKVKVPHMLYDQLQGIKRSPPSYPMLTVEVSVATDGYKEVGAMADLEKAASGASSACGHFVGNHTILRTF